ncbi:MAG: TolC family protein [Candidatus Omnitrophota bacterium]
MMPRYAQKTIIFFFVCILTIRVHSYAETALGKNSGISIEGAIAIAVNNNKTVQMQMANIKKASAGQLWALSEFLPKAKIGYDFTYNDAVYSLPTATAARKDPGLFQGYESDNMLSLEVDQDFIKGGANVARYKQSNLELLSQKETYRATVLEVEFETKKLFYGLLLAYETERIARDLVVQAQAHYEEVSYKYKHGTASKFDLLQSKVQVARIMPQLINAENSIKLIKAELKKLLAFDMRENIEIAGRLGYNPIKIREEDFLMEAYENRPEMKLKSLGVDIEKWGIEFAKSTGVLQVSGNFTYYARSNNVADMLNSRHDNWHIGLRATMPLFDGLATPAKINEARAKYEHAKLDEEDYINQIAVDVRQACINMEDAETIIAAQKDSIVEAKEALRLSEVRYRNGVGINLDVLDSQVALAEVEQSLAEATYDYIMGKADLIKVMGREFFKEEKWER